MALADKKITDIFNKRTGGAKDAKSITDAKELEIKTKFDNGEHIEDNGMFTNLAPALYAVQQVADDIEEIRRFITSEITSITTSQANAITANTAKTGISTSQASAITANTAKVSQGLATANHTMQFDVINTKGTYTLRITIVDSTNPKVPVTKTVDIRLS
jgi:hypothetical protein